MENAAPFKVPDWVEVTVSRGRNSTGHIIYFIRPAMDCWNNSRRARGREQLEYVIKRWYHPQVHYYLIDDLVIGSNNEKDALREYWRICDRDKIKKTMPVMLLHGYQAPIKDSFIAELSNAVQGKSTAPVKKKVTVVDYMTLDRVQFDGVEVTPENLDDFDLIRLFENDIADVYQVSKTKSTLILRVKDKRFYDGTGILENHKKIGLRWYKDKPSAMIQLLTDLSNNPKPLPDAKSE